MKQAIDKRQVSLENIKKHLLFLLLKERIYPIRFNKKTNTKTSATFIWKNNKLKTLIYLSICLIENNVYISCWNKNNIDDLFEPYIFKTSLMSVISFTEIDCMLKNFLILYRQYLKAYRF